MGWSVGVARVTEVCLKELCKTGGGGGGAWSGISEKRARRWKCQFLHVEGLAPKKAMSAAVAVCLSVLQRFRPCEGMV